MDVAVTEKLKDTQLGTYAERESSVRKVQGLEQDIESLKKCGTNLDQSFDRVNG